MTVCTGEITHLFAGQRGKLVAVTLKGSEVVTHNLDEEGRADCCHSLLRDNGEQSFSSINTNRMNFKSGPHSAKLSYKQNILCY